MIDLVASFPHYISFAAGASIIGAVVKVRDERRKRAAGSLLLVTDGVDHRQVRWAKCNLRSWTGGPIRIRSLRVVLPLSAAGFSWDDVNEEVGIKMFDRSFPSPTTHRLISLKNELIIQPDKAKQITVMVDPGLRLKRRSSRKSRLLLHIGAETLDAQRRRTTLLLWSNPVDWSKPPQE